MKEANNNDVAALAGKALGLAKHNRQNRIFGFQHHMTSLFITSLMEQRNILTTGSHIFSQTVPLDIAPEVQMILQPCFDGIGFD